MPRQHMSSVPQQQMSSIPQHRQHISSMPQRHMLSLPRQHMSSKPGQDTSSMTRQQKSSMPRQDMSWMQDMSLRNSLIAPENKYFRKFYFMMEFMLCVLIKLASSRRFLLHSTCHYCIEVQKDVSKLSPFAS